MKVGGEDQKQKSAGGVFLYLLKKSPEVSKEQQKIIFRVEKLKQSEKKKTFRLFNALNIDRIGDLTALMMSGDQSNNNGSKNEEMAICNEQQ
mmetsp:Transcript_456/g.520  ORF Transcript_456/g.520 Transcript_456/m.520 type:complete len:92 (-) Transcript_456:25-300(-)